MSYGLDGLGYYDDGEEHLGDEDGAHESNRKRSNAAVLSASALKKARKAKAAVRAVALGGEEKPEDDLASSNRSMWDFVRRGTSASRTVSATSRPSTAASSNLDYLLGDLDDLVASSKTRTSGANRRVVFGRSVAPAMRRGRATTPVRRRPEQKEQEILAANKDEDIEEESAMDVAFANDNDDNEEVPTETSNPLSQRAMMQLPQQMPWQLLKIQRLKPIVPLLKPRAIRRLRHHLQP